MKLLVGALVLTLALTACDDDKKPKSPQVDQSGGGPSTKGSSSIGGEPAVLSSVADNDRIQGSFASASSILVDSKDGRLEQIANKLNIYTIEGDYMVLQEIDLVKKVFMVSHYNIGLDGEFAEIIPTLHSCQEYQSDYKENIGKVHKAQILTRSDAILVANKEGDRELMARIHSKDLEIIDNKLKREYVFMNNENCELESKTSDENVENTKEIDKILSDFMAN